MKSSSRKASEVVCTFIIHSYDHSIIHIHSFSHATTPAALIGMLTDPKCVITPPDARTLSRAVVFLWGVESIPSFIAPALQFRATLFESDGVKGGSQPKCECEEKKVNQRVGACAYSIDQQCLCHPVWSSSCVVIICSLIVCGVRASVSPSAVDFVASDSSIPWTASQRRRARLNSSSGVSGRR